MDPVTDDLQILSLYSRHQLVHHLTWPNFLLIHFSKSLQRSSFLSMYSNCSSIGRRNYSELFFIHVTKALFSVLLLHISEQNSTALGLSYSCQKRLFVVHLFYSRQKISSTFLLLILYTNTFRFQHSPEFRNIHGLFDYVSSFG